MLATSRDIEAFVLLACALHDYLMLLTGALFISETTLAYLVVANYDGLTNSYMTSEERAVLDPNSTEYYKRVSGSKIQVLGWSLTGLMQFDTRVRVAYIFLGVVYLATALSILLSCQPMHKFWQINPDPGISKVYILVGVVLNVFTDAFLLCIPLPLLWKVEIGLKRKISLMILFSGGIFIIAASIIRAAMVLSSGPDGAVQGSKWACRETFVSIAIANLPIIFPLIRTCANKIGLSALFSSSGRPSNSHPLSSKRASGRELPSRSTKRHHPLSIPGSTEWDTEENILVNTNHAHASINALENGSMKSGDNDKPNRGAGIMKEVTIVQESGPSP
uniref:Rhodopsin domain-containing protein n=1 Tax=Talaromyces marneffei PM1 TaxID=1077442 RepID=A0A093XC20_TALMA